MTSASIIPYPTRVVSNRLSFHDKVDVCRWETAGPPPHITRVVIHDHVETNTNPIDFVLVYGAGSLWACWGLARRGGDVMLWRCNDGADLGAFKTMAEALAAMERHASLPTRVRLPAEQAALGRAGDPSPPPDCDCEQNLAGYPDAVKANRRASAAEGA